MFSPARFNLILPAAGNPTRVVVFGQRLVVESAAGGTPTSCPLVRLGGRDSQPLPCYTSGVFTLDDESYNELWFEGQGESVGTTVYLISLTTPCITIDLPATVEQP